MDERTALLALSLVPGVGSARLHTLVKAYGNDPIAAWRGRASWPQRAGISSAIAAAAASVRATKIEEERRRLEDLGARIVISTDLEYPSGLRDVPGPAPVLFVRGRLPSEDDSCVAIVGTRRPSRSGERTSHELATQLAAVGIGVVSGLALGIDGAAHRGALQVAGTTVAVLGCGLDYAYPRVHAELMEAIADTGAVITEYTLGTKPLPRHFPARNRIIAGLSSAVILVESGRSGGALHTVEYALSAGRDVMVVPGDVHRWQSDAPNQLIRDGAIVIRHAADVLHELGHTSRPRQNPQPSPSSVRSDHETAAEDDALSRRILEVVHRDGPLTADELGAKLQVSVAAMAAALTWLEVTGRCVRVPGGRFDASR